MSRRRFGDDFRNKRPSLTLLVPHMEVKVNIYLEWKPQGLRKRCPSSMTTESQ